MQNTAFYDILDAELTDIIAQNAYEEALRKPKQISQQKPQTNNPNQYT